MEMRIIDPSISVWVRRPEMAERIKELYSHPDLSGSDIARILSEECGETITRNMVLGKLYRLGLLTEHPRMKIRSAAMSEQLKQKREARERKKAEKMMQRAEPPFKWTKDLDLYMLRLRREMNATPSTIGIRMLKEKGTRPATTDIRARLNWLRDRGYDIGDAGELAVDIEAESGGVPFDRHDFYTCHWPMHDNGQPAVLCGKPLFHSAYCKEHAARAFTCTRDPRPLGGVAA